MNTTASEICDETALETLERWENITQRTSIETVNIPDYIEKILDYLDILSIKLHDCEDKNIKPATEICLQRIMDVLKLTDAFISSLGTENIHPEQLSEYKKRRDQIDSACLEVLNT